MRTITLEEHFATRAYLDGPDRSLKERAERDGGCLAKLVVDLIDLGEGRVEAMDAAGITMQALSLTAPGVEQLAVEEAKRFARETNAAIGRAVERCPDRFFGLASLPLNFLAFSARAGAAEWAAKGRTANGGACPHRSCAAYGRLRSDLS